MHRFLLPLFLIPLLLIACGKKEVTVPEDSIGEEQIQFALPEQGKVVHPEHGEEKWFAYGSMAGEGQTPANGVVQAYRFEDGTYTLTMQLNIEIAPEGSFYEVWLVDEDGLVTSAGHLFNHFGDVRHQLTFESTQDLRASLSVEVTLEADDGDPTQSQQVVARGTLKRTRR